MGAYYNEFDPGAAAWLRALIGEGLICPGDVDTRSIKDVQADDLAGYTQAHFFAGIGVWSHALRRAGWPDDRPVWSGSCPCQPFSLAGNQGGFDDPRHLWPDWLRLIVQRRPDIVFGEQVASAGHWLDLVSADLESHGFAFGSPDLAAAGFDGAHIRQRAFWVADTDNAEWWSDRAPRHFGDGPQAGRVEGHGNAGDGFADGWLANGASERWDGREQFTRPSGGRVTSDRGGPGRLGDASGYGSHQISGNDGEVRGLSEAQRQPEHGAALSGRPSATGGLGDAHYQGSSVGPWAPDSQGAVRFQGPTIMCRIEVVTQKSRTEACHPKFGLDGHWREFGGGEKSHDRMAVPLCGGRHHRESQQAEHQVGQRRFWEQSGVILPDLIADLNDAFDQHRDMTVVIQQHAVRALGAQIRARKA